MNTIMNHTKKNHGFTLIELLIAMSILVVVGGMTMTLMGSASRLYHSTIQISGIQTESQTVSRMLSNAVMDAKTIYLTKEEDGTVLFTGNVTTRTNAATGEYKVYYGEMFWWDKESSSLYHGRNVSVSEAVKGAGGTTEGAGGATEGAGGAIAGAGGTTTDAGGITAGAGGANGGAEDSGEAVEDDGPTTAGARSFFTGGTGDGREYLLSDKVKNVEIDIFSETGGDDGSEPAGIVTVNYALTFSYMDSQDYKTESSATTRNRMQKVWMSREK